MLKVKQGITLKSPKPPKIVFSDALEDLIASNVKALQNKVNKNRRRRGKKPKDLPLIEKEMADRFDMSDVTS